MKKAVVFIMVLSLVLSAALAFGTANVSSWTSGTLTFKGSSSVTVQNSASTTTYAAVAKHFQGDKRYGATSTSTTLYSSVSTAGYTVTASEVTASDSGAFGSGWTAL
ncbi:MAG: hypothetical protein WC855_10100 [Thermodesulfovibrionales bacterium]